MIMVTMALLLVMITFSGTIRALLMSSVSVPSVGAVKAVGVGVYWDSGCTSRVSSIDWGMVEPGSTKIATVFIRNEGNAAITLSMDLKNWSPPTASNYIGLKWNYNGQAINPNGAMQVTLTLSVSSSITGISSFSFDIVMMGSG